jgi:hypothetical protein
MQEIEHSVKFALDNFKRYTLLDRAKAVQVCVDCMFDAMSADCNFMFEIVCNGFKGFEFFEDEELLQEVAALDLMEDALEEGWVRFE